MGSKKLWEKVWKCQSGALIFAIPNATALDDLKRSEEIYFKNNFKKACKFKKSPYLCTPKRNGVGS